ncbi:unnamed protein product [Adineta ricciae]|uniref:Fucosyltransferase n=1 Tax=Adineta ricciae TaxID=249248 RepID=A0A813YVY0_ADIRI|nr:unnamed protein product [Adineta ricciae]CAF1098612.1 unnamed protein product [Adineta ricciae]
MLPNTKYSPKHQSVLRIWRRRYSFHLGKLRCKWVMYFCVAFLFLVFLLPNPFASRYDKLMIRQDIRWEGISEILEEKEKILVEDPFSKQVKFRRYGKEELSSTRPVLILLYTTIFLSKKYCKLKQVEHIFGETCPSKHRCQWTCDVRKLNEADAVIFHGYDMQYYPSEMPKRSDTKSDAIWILWSDEPHSMVDYSLFKDYRFNWTISFKLNSEVSIGSYGLFQKRNVPQLDSEHRLWIERQFRDRSNAALWFVSNCEARERLQYYRDLRREANVYVEGYGRCVDYYPMHLCAASSQCEIDYMSKFKYYLSFESITCRDYITEKFFKAFYHGLIPIVYGPERKDYERFAPADSFIHVNDFNKNMNKLANYLLEIHLNLTLFAKYHQWRKTHDVIIDGKALERIRMCELCERLTRVRREDVTYYEDINEFYHEKC